MDQTDGMYEANFDLDTDDLGHEILFRASDRARISPLLNAIITRRANVILIGTNPTAIDHYGRLIIQRLRQKNDIEISTLLEASEDSLLQKINALLDPLSLDTARRPPLPNQKPRIWLLQLQTENQVQQTKLVSRMVSDFPGVNISLILLAAPYVAQPFLNTGLGKAMLQWPVRAPDSTEMVNMLANAEHNGRGPECRALLDRLGHPVTADPQTAVDPAQTSKRLFVAAKNPDGSAAKRSVLPRFPLKGLRWPTAWGYAFLTRLLKRLLILVLILLVLGVGLMQFLGLGTEKTPEKLQLFDPGESVAPDAKPQVSPTIDPPATRNGNIDMPPPPLADALNLKETSSLSAPPPKKAAQKKPSPKAKPPKQPKTVKKPTQTTQPEKKTSPKPQAATRVHPLR